MSGFNRYAKNVLVLIFTLSVLVAIFSSADSAQKDQSLFAISFDDVSALAIKNNFEIQLLKFDALMAAEQMDQTLSMFDTIAAADLRYQEDQQARTTTLFGTEITDYQYGFGLTKKFSTGTKMAFNQQFHRNASDSVFATNSVTHNAIASLSVTQSLGRNFFGMNDRDQIKLSELGVANAEYTSIRAIETSLANVQKNYWDLVLSQQIMTIEESMVEQAKKLYEHHQSKLDEGLVDLPEAVASEANYQQRLNEWRLAKNARQIIANRMKFFLNIEDDELDFVAVDEANIITFDQDMATTLKIALTSRRDLISTKNQLQQRDIELVVSQNELLPQIELSATFQRNGLGGGFDKATSDVFEEDNPLFAVGLSFEIPLENRKAKARLNQNELAKKKSILDLKRVEKQIMVDVVNQFQNCRVLYDVAQNAKLIAELKQKKLQAEQKRYQQGRSDTDTIIRYQEELLQARRQSAAAIVSYLHARIDLAWTEGTLLDPYWDFKG